ncbi:MAG: hypothetical protein V4486_03265 [Patescibacteria group bacterium]
MDPESKKLLEEIKVLTEENSKMLHSMHRSMRMQRIMSILYWVFIIGSTVGAFYLIQPYIDSLKGAYGGANDILKGFQN